MKKILLIFTVLILFLTPTNAEISVESTQDIINKIPEINNYLIEDPQELPSPLSWLFKNEKIAINILMQDQSTETIIVETKDGILNSVSQQGKGTGYTITVTECGLDTAIRNENSFEVYSYLYQQKEITISASSFGKKILLGIAKPFIKSATKKSQTQVDIECTQIIK
ncbi:hypothetical protein K8R47_03880 [archaeon]|nr:hypothetical protein [archaeon]